MIMIIRMKGWTRTWTRTIQIYKHYFLQISFNGFQSHLAAAQTGKPCTAHIANAFRKPYPPQNYAILEPNRSNRSRRDATPLSVSHHAHPNYSHIKVWSDIPGWRTCLRINPQWAPGRQAETGEHMRCLIRLKRWTCPHGISSKAWLVFCPGI